MKHKGYYYNPFGRVMIPIPGTLLLGQGYGEEIPVDEGSFDMLVEMRHPVWGKFYSYSGRFRVVEVYN